MLWKSCNKRSCVAVHQALLLFYNSHQLFSGIAYQQVVDIW